MYYSTLTFDLSREFQHDDTSDSLAILFQVYHILIVSLYPYWLVLDLTISQLALPPFHPYHPTLAAIWNRIKPPLKHFPTLSNFVVPLDSFNAYAQISSRALRQSLKETPRLNAEKRGMTDLRFQKWENGNGGPQVCPSSVSDVCLPPNRECLSSILSKSVQRGADLHTLRRSTSIPRRNRLDAMRWPGEIHVTPGSTRPYM